MSDDREVLREVWDGRIPTCFNLALQEVETLTAPDPYYLMLPRLSYLPIVTEKIKKHFSKFVKPELLSNIMWFEIDDIPVKWHLPIGVLFDQAKLQNTELNLPWNITVHFDKFPNDKIIKFESTEEMEIHFMSSVKEADHIKHSGKVVSTMQKKDHKQLWQGLQNDKFDQFWAVNRRLMEYLGGDDCFKHIPIRMFNQNRPMLQKLYKAQNEEKQNLLLKDILKDVLPDKKLDEVQVITQGIEPSLDTPLQWLSEHLSYPDNFLYLCVK